MPNYTTKLLPTTALNCCTFLVTVLISFRAGLANEPHRFMVLQAIHEYFNISKKIQNFHSTEKLSSFQVLLYSSHSSNQISPGPQLSLPRPRTSTQHLIYFVSSPNAWPSNAWQCYSFKIQSNSMYPWHFVSIIKACYPENTL